MTAQESIIELYTSTFGSAPASVAPLAGAGSARRYFRLRPAGADEGRGSVIGTSGTDAAENRAFIKLARHFTDRNLPVPAVIAKSPDGMSYLQDDLGDTSLFDAIKNGRTTGRFTAEETGLLEKTMAMMARIQHAGAEGIDWSVCFPQEAMDSAMIRWDLNHFKYCFLKPSGAWFPEPELEQEFDRLHNALLARASEARTFMARDFQSRNVMLRNGEPFLIDFQGGRRGPVEYDVASLLWQAKAGIPPELREHLIDTYVSEALKQDSRFDANSFRASLPRMVLFRMLQTLGAYGLRGITERKPHFLTSIPAALRNLTRHLEATGLAAEFPVITRAVTDAAVTPLAADISALTSVPARDGLTVTVTSFSYKRGVPPDISGNGGGFVFDCRAIHNPGCYEPYKPLTGRDEAVKKFLEDDGEIILFLDSAWGMTDASINRYLRRGFSSLCINFGCTGGRHRSVYSAEATARHIAATFPQVRIVLWHREQGIIETTEPTAAQQ